ncbi:MAG: class I SAM-dependent methyltransferase [Nitrospinae bacterium]|nr:class I SAM-dependent methyltransferase [Nitrospinota bacterium]
MSSHQKAGDDTGDVWTLSHERLQEAGKIAIFGAGSAAGMIIRQFKSSGVPIACVVDNDLSRSGGNICGRKVEPPSRLLAGNIDYIVLASEPGYPAISRQLQQMGFSEFHDFASFRLFLEDDDARGGMWKAFALLREKGLGALAHVPLAVRLLSKIFREVAISGKGSDICLENGFLPLTTHYYSPVPDLDDLKKRDVWSVKSRLAGIDFREREQLELLETLGREYGAQCRWPGRSTGDPTKYHTGHDGFSFGCAAALYSMIRHLRPRRIVEIGSGMSSLVIQQAIGANSDNGAACRHTIIDPYPRVGGWLGGVEIIESRVEFLTPDIFGELAADDILFIDSSHSVKIGGDVNYLYLEILPRLANGVSVHVHDIAMPYEYPVEYATSEVFRQFWTEQYLLQAFLSLNERFEILLAMTSIMKDHPEEFKKAFPFYDPALHKRISSSFWFRRKPA